MGSVMEWLAALFPGTKAAIITGSSTIIAACLAAFVVMLQIGSQSRNAIKQNAYNEALRLKVGIYQHILAICEEAQDAESEYSILTSFQNLGVRISLDDFGMGYSNMYNLADLRFDKIKIDRSFIQSMSGNPESLAIVNAVVALSKRLGVPTLAGGVENKEAMLKLIDSGCEFGQGYLFGRAVSASETSEIIAQARGPGVGGRRNAAA